MATRSENFLMGAELPVVEVEGGMKRKILGFDGQLMLLEVSFKKGDIGYIHQHFHSQSTYVVSGIFEVTICDKTEILKAGDGFYVEPNILHGAVCLETGILIDTFSPIRLDFLPK